MAVFYGPVWIVLRSGEKILGFFDDEKAAPGTNQVCDTSRCIVYAKKRHDCIVYVTKGYIAAMNVM